MTSRGKVENMWCLTLSPQKMNTFVIFSRATSHLAFYIPRVLCAQFLYMSHPYLARHRVLHCDSNLLLCSFIRIKSAPNTTESDTKYEHLPESFLLRSPHYPTCVLNVVFVHYTFSHLLLSPLCRWAHWQHLVLLFASNHFRARQCVLSFHPITSHVTVSCYFSSTVT